MGVKLGILVRSGAWYEYQGNRFANGREAGKQYLESHPELMEELLKKIQTGEVQ